MPHLTSHVLVNYVGYTKQLVVHMYICMYEYMNTYNTYCLCLFIYILFSLLYVTVYVCTCIRNIINMESLLLLIACVTHSIFFQR